MGELDIANLLGSATAALPWFNREGSGQGWGYSVLGGSKARRPNTNVNNVPKVPVSWDNTLQARSRGDFAVPTLFNGNFDASFEPPAATLNPLNSSLQRNQAPIFGSTAVAGWSFRNNTGLTWEDGAASTQSLVDWKDIPTFAAPGGYLSKLGIDSTAADYQPNYAIELNGGDSITHNRFLVPDWGALRFDLHVPDPAIDDNTGYPSVPVLGTGTVKVYINDTELKTSAYQGVFPSIRSQNKLTFDYPAVDLRKFDSTLLSGINPAQFEAQSNKIDFATEGFQTFQVDIPNYLRGQVATLRFEVEFEASKTVYLDNVFFKSEHLLFGNPQSLIADPSDPSNNFHQEARKSQDTPPPNSGLPGNSPEILNPSQEPNTFRNNYLIERPQYSLSYNDELKTLNWVSYKLNKSWLGAPQSVTPKTYPRDPRLPFLTNNIIDDGDIKNTSSYSKGHMTTRSHRDRTKQDYFSTFLSSDILPQPLNKPNNTDRWTELEKYLRVQADLGKEVYIVSGRDGKAPDTVNGGDLWLPSNTNQRLSVPNSVWKVVLILDRPGMGIADVNQNTLAFGIHLPNTLVLDPITNQLIGRDPDKFWERDFPTLIDGVQYGLFNIDEIESRTGYNFFSNIPEDIQNIIESRDVGSQTSPAVDTIRAKI
ncbi:DNA/RNA non-specific endonuclease [Chamaesiphon polymorphus]|uniref:DNA/RNA non-specific endonuclease n=1 Tax=Chamaesiphon polymorphus TaxID=2107691 RepID=UPI0015E769D4|nr:DNA/RNA non-specific endonuclease [Chamaesiphon polymorphus]